MAFNYAGMSPEQAEAEARKLFKQAIETGRWFDLPERLSMLRKIIQRPNDKQRQLL